MAKILSINGFGEERSNSLLDEFKNWFSSQDKFVKNTFIVFLLLLIATPIFIANRFSLLQHAAPNGGVVFVSADGLPIKETASPNVFLQLSYPESWDLSQAVSPGFVNKVYADGDSCDFSNLHDGDSYDTYIPSVTVSGVRSNPSYFVSLYVGGVSPGSIQADTLTTSNLTDLKHWKADAGVATLECRIQTEPGGGQVLFSKSITLRRPSPTTAPTATSVPPTIASTPTATPLPTESATPAATGVPVEPSASPTEMPEATPTTTVITKPVLFKIAIRNADNSNSNGEKGLEITGAQNIANALSKPVAWELTPLTQGQEAAQRSVEVTYYAHAANGDTHISVTANILLAKEQVSPTAQVSPTVLPQETPTVTIAVSSPTSTVVVQQPTMTPVAPIITSTIAPTAPLPSPTPTAAGPVEGDVNMNGCVDTTDFNIWAEAFQKQTVVQGTNPDIDHNGRIDINDASIWYQITQRGEHACQ